MAASSIDNVTFSRQMLFRLYAVAVAYIFLSHRTVLELFSIWLERSDYSHGFLVPLISGYFVWVSREKLKRIAVEPNLILGISIVIAGIFVQILGDIGSVQMIETFSIIIIVPGVVLLLFGTVFLRALALPLSYLVLMIQIMDLVMERIHWPFQIISAILSSTFLKIIGIPVLRNMQFLQLPNITLEVADECSGVHFLISIIAIGIPLAYLTQNILWRRLALISAGVLIGVFANSIRITLIGLWTYMGGDAIHGPMHILHGFFVSMVGLFFFFIISFYFSAKPAVAEADTGRVSKNEPNRPVYDKKKFGKAWYIVMALLLFGSGVLLVRTSHITATPEKSLAMLPGTIGKWEYVNVNSELPFSLRNADFELKRTYTDPSGRQVTLYIAYFNYQTQDKEFVHYDLHRLFRDYSETDVKGLNTNINKTLVRGTGSKSVVLYWFNKSGTVIASRYKAKLAVAVDGLLTGKTNGAFVAVVSEAGRNDDADGALEAGLDFTGSLLRIFPTPSL